MYVRGDTVGTLQFQLLSVRLRSGTYDQFDVAVLGFGEELSRKVSRRARSAMFQRVFFAVMVSV